MKREESAFWISIAVFTVLDLILRLVFAPSDKELRELGEFRKVKALVSRIPGSFTIRIRKIEVGPEAGVAGSPAPEENSASGQGGPLSPDQDRDSLEGVAGGKPESDSYPVYGQPWETRPHEGSPILAEVFNNKTGEIVCRVPTLQARLVADKLNEMTGD